MEAGGKSAAWSISPANTAASSHPRSGPEPRSRTYQRHEREVRHDGLRPTRRRCGAARRSRASVAPVDRRARERPHRPREPEDARARLASDRDVSTRLVGRLLPQRAFPRLRGERTPGADPPDRRGSLALGRGSEARGHRHAHVGARRPADRGRRQRDPRSGRARRTARRATQPRPVLGRQRVDPERRGTSDPASARGRPRPPAPGRWRWRPPTHPARPDRVRGEPKGVPATGACRGRQRRPCVRRCAARAAGGRGRPDVRRGGVPPARSVRSQGRRGSVVPRRAVDSGWPDRDHRRPHAAAAPQRTAGGRPHPVWPAAGGPARLVDPNGDSPDQRARYSR
jgi:hypothetical protein